MDYNYLMENKRTFKLVLTSLMAAACYICFTFMQIKIQTPAGYTSFHLGNLFCVLAGIIIDPVSGGIAGAIGMGIGDVLDPVYITTAPKTIILKFFMGFIAGKLAEKLDLKNREGKQLIEYTVIAISLAALFNIIAEPFFSYFYYSFIMGNSKKAAGYLTAAKWITTATNSALTAVLGCILYLEIRKRLPERFWK